KARIWNLAKRPELVKNLFSLFSNLFALTQSRASNQLTKSGCAFQNDHCHSVRLFMNNHKNLARILPSLPTRFVLLFLSAERTFRGNHARRQHFFSFF
ncbi:MAG: hypothetical protein R3Y11_12635, partial [Pseudomonadota bacterium]